MKNNLFFLTIIMMFGISNTTHAQWTDPAPLVVAPAAGNLVWGMSLIEINGRPALAVYDAANFELDFMRANDASGSSWPAPITIDDDFRAGFSSVDIEIINGNPAVVADDPVHKEIRYTRATDANGASWGTTVIVTSVDNAIGGDLHLDLEVVSGNPAVAFYSSDNQDLEYVRANDADGTAWGTPVVVASTNSIGWYNSMEIVNGHPAIAFYDDTDKDLKFVRANDATGSSWGSVQSVATTGNVGEFCSMAIVNSRPAIVYRDETNQNVKYVRANNADGTSWGTPVTVHGEDGKEFELMVINNIPVIAYRTHDNGSADKDLAYIAASDMDGATWGTRQIVDGTSLQTGRDLSLALINGNPAIAYRDLTNSDIKYTRMASDNTAPSTTSFTRKTPSAQNTNNDQLTFLATFSEDVVNVDANDFSASGTTANIAVTQVTASTYDIILSGGNLANLNGTVGLNFSGSVSIQDVAGNTLPNTEPSTNQTYMLDNTPNAVCQNISVSLNTSNTISITASQIDNGSTVQVGSPSLSLSQTTFSCSDIGMNTVTLTVTDGNSQTDDCTATVTINPNATSGDNTWLGAVNSDWAEPCNWSYGSVPTASQIVAINAPSNAPIIMAGTNAVAQRVKVNGTTVFTINANGSLTINGATNNGISIQSNAQLNNNGTIKIDNILGTAGNRSGIALGGTLVNNGTIEIGKNGGGVNFGFYSAVGSLNNQSGTIDITATGSTSIWLQQSSTGINNSCATILVNKRIRVIQSATFQNDGFIYYGQGTTGNAISPFVNNGVVEDPNEVLPNSVTNNDLIISPISTSNGVFNNALEIGSSNSFTVANQWFKDENLTMLAGNYDAAMNTFTPNQANLPAGQHTLYFQVTDNINSCSRTVQINVTVSYLPIVSVAMHNGTSTPESSGTLTYRFSLDAAIANDLMINYSIAGSADNVDYSVTTNANTTYTAGSQTGTIKILAGQTFANLIVNPTSETAVEENETVVVKIEMP